jgi:hypothetical protein
MFLKTLTFADTACTWTKGSPRGFYYPAEQLALAALRDTLLPKLLSGEVRVPKAMLAQSEGANL